MRHIFSFVLFFLLCSQALVGQSKLKKDIADTLNVIANKEIWVGNVSVKSISTNEKDKKITIIANESLGYLPFREESVDEIYSAIRAVLPPSYSRYTISCRVGENDIEDLIPNYYRRNSIDSKRQFDHRNTTPPLLKNISRPNEVSRGMQNRYIALWQSHGWHYDQSLARWEWQRARLFQTVEDLYTQSYVLPFLVPMLESAGANVLMPRERDTQIHEVIVDNDAQFSTSKYQEKYGDSDWKDGKKRGFAHTQNYYLFRENPFELGTYRQCETTKDRSRMSMVEWIPDIPEAGKYAVYVSYKTLANSSDKVNYAVYHKGGITRFEVNQTMYGGTWLYLGHFDFEQGISENGKVVLDNHGAEKDKIVTADAVKFGGGMGNIARSPILLQTIKTPRDTVFFMNNSSVKDLETTTEVFTPLISSYFPKIDTSNFVLDSVYMGKSKKSLRNPDRIYFKGRKFTNTTVEIPSLLHTPEISGYPRFTEGSRYWLQWAGMPDSIYSRSQNRNDYTDDFQSRGFWVNYISGGSSVMPRSEGLNVPVDLSFAFHSDAGTTNCDSIIGTLGICTTRGHEKKYVYKNGVSRLAARDLTDIVQTQIVSDVREVHAAEWVRRGIWDKSYSESRVPEVPAMMLELLSHQNFADMRYGLDPRFRFTVSRAVYKGILKYFESVYGERYVVQPLPVEQFSIRFVDDNEVELSWMAVNDPLEPSAKAEQYVVYTQIADGGFDNGYLIDKNYYRIKINPDEIYNFKITAVNTGGESFPSETLSVCRASQSKGDVLIINGFDRVCAPESFMIDSTYAGFVNTLDAGVPYINDISFIGEQYEYRRDISWVDDDAPGFGASHGTHETMVIAGNTFNYPALHGQAIKEAGYSFVSCSKKAIINGIVNLNDFKIADLILGKQKETYIGNRQLPPEFKTFPLALQLKIEQFTQNGGNLFVSGSNVASDMYNSSDTTGYDIAFVENTLKCKLRNAQASVSGHVRVVQSFATTFEKSNFEFYDAPNPVSYYVETPDAIEPIDEGGHTICRYSENNLSAGIVYNAGRNKICVLGFPFETIKNESERNKLMKSVLEYLSN